MSSTTHREGVKQTSAIAGPADAVTFQRFKLIVTSGPDTGMECLSDSAELGIGTAEGNQLVLTDSTVSRHHCTITATGLGFLLRDLESTNGTTLGGFRVMLALLKPGAVIGLGKTTLRFEALGEEIREPLSEDDRYGRALGTSVAMRRIFALLPRVAASESTVLLEGETGTGKTILAEALHEGSSRAKRPFVVVDCGAIPPTLIESVLFGHEKGAFTGAHSARAGAFESATGGTVFLDEIGELPMEMQPKLLRAIESRVINRVGSVDAVQLDVRVIAATNRDLREMVNRGTFRADLFFRLNIVRLRIPPLRERRDDIPFLIEHFYKQLADEPSADAIAELQTVFMRLDWPGNVRELRNAVERAVLLGHIEDWEEGPPSPSVSPPNPDDPAPALDFSIPFRDSKEQVINAWECTYFRELLRRHAGNVSAAARAAQMDRSYLRMLLKRHGIAAREED